ncbi:hypothetical protein LEP1GSC103_1971 [Leptospira borgpetersenii serovar Javanica str. UI 09931]|uniref:Uncharacterized protein n=2 Tax=Leptospira borgpetersenii TaxID=174 RepID=A0A0S2ISN0_LEPBO|nr:hypothetical protein LBBP_02431 [Leptospira borgpetersenii serovar Ballum]EKQ91656.1 hypothetical protein LEP1GSC101_0729 [Leptospira borgpetersenii str. UI 09149]EKQ99210.1 hypothetical protein LEP1GSC121_2457 [Leptospira borgpetersenii serovar Castellonis str. 200801910]EMN56270.1 hypothetical protein LEP1GSC090_0017 [Leptospira borgpetersenii serovar Javanica str. MK146]EMO10591.1 hypothetical protein LEP1GSC137_3628 [Leptospira borgpetersenii str. Noumea 25]EPG56808.1 hypothetical prote
MFNSRFGASNKERTNPFLNSEFETELETIRLLLQYATIKEFRRKLSIRDHKRYA